MPRPAVLRSGQSESTLTFPFLSLPLTDYEGHSVTPVPGYATAAPELRPDFKNTISSATKLLIRTAERTSDALPPLKSVVGGLCAILENCEVLSTFVHPAPVLTVLTANDGRQPIDRIVRISG